METARVRISGWQLTMLIVAVQLSALASYAPVITGELPPTRDAWLVPVVLLAPVALMGLGAYALCRRFPRLTIFEMTSHIFGAWVAPVVNAVLVLFFIHWAGVGVRQFAEFFTSTLYVNTPPVVFSIMLGVIVIYAVASGLELIGRAAEVAGLLAVAGFLLYFVLLIPEYRVEQLLPVLGEGLMPVVLQSLVPFWVFAQLVWVLVLTVPHLVDMREAPKYAALGLGIYVYVVGMGAAVLIMVLGPEILALTAFPTFSASRLISIGRVIERVEWLLVIMWIGSMLIKVSLLTYGAVLGLSQTLRPRGSWGLWTLLVGTAMVAWGHVTFQGFTELLRVDAPLGQLMTAGPLVLAPLLIFFAAVLRGARADSPAEGGTPGREARPYGP